jgi:ABC-type glycerol-3-phosphate transport system permease component
MNRAHFYSFMQPIMCSLGYSNSFSGVAAALVFIGGVVGSVILGAAVAFVGARSKNPATSTVCLAKTLCLPLAAVMAALVAVMRRPNIESAVASLNFALGFLAMGMYPTLLEFSVEATYPNDEVIKSKSCILEE